MSAVASWLNENWFSLLQSLGIGGSLLFTAVTLREDLQSKRVTEYLALANQHRRLWGQLHRRPRLARLLESNRDLTTFPVTIEERVFLKLAFVHFHTGWLLAREGSLTPLRVLAIDAGNFFRLPAPLAVWNSVRSAHQPEFVTFIAEAVSQSIAREAMASGAHRENQTTPE